MVKQKHDWENFSRQIYFSISPFWNTVDLTLNLRILKGLLVDFYLIL